MVSQKKKKHRHLVETSLTLLYQSYLPLNYWSYTFSIASFLINRLPSFVLGFISPWEKINYVSQPLSTLKTFSCACYAYLRPYNKHKFQPRSVECVFLGYPPLSKGYLCLDPTTNTMYTTCYALLDENVFPFAQKSGLTNPYIPFSNSSIDYVWFLSTSPPIDSTSASSSSPQKSFDEFIPFTSAFSSFDTVSCLPSSSSSSTPSIPSVPIPDPVSSSSSTIPAPNASISHNPLPIVNHHPMVTRSKIDIHKPKILKVGSNYTYQEPPSYHAAIKYSQWVAAMDSEFQSFLRQNTWSLVPPPADKNIVTCKWVFTMMGLYQGIKLDWWQSRGYLQQYDLDYDETFSPVMKPTTMRLLLALAVNYGWDLKQLDVSNASFMVCLKRRYIWLNLRVMWIHHVQTMFTFYIRPYMA